LRVLELDLYQKNNATLRKLLAKRQNPCTQIFKCQQLSNKTNQPKAKVNLLGKVISSPIPTQNSPTPLNLAQNRNYFSNNVSQNNSSNSTINSQKSPFSSSNSSEEDESIEKIRKKIKVSVHDMMDSRKSSFYDDKDVSDHSTTCENHSEGTPAVEVADLQWSPLFNFKPSKDLPVLILDENEPTSNISNPFANFVSADDFLTFTKVQSQAEKLGGSCLSNAFLPNGKLRLKCKLRHQWEASVEELEHKWCSKCETLLKKCRSFARQNGGVCLNELFDDVIKFQCRKGHQWDAKSKTYDSKWCSECIQEEKELRKKKCEEERKRREKIEEEYQKKLFEEARRKVTENFMCNEKPVEEDVLAYFQKIDREVENLAQKEAEQFLSRENSCQKVNFQQVLQVYKVLIMPEEILQKYMTSLNLELLKSEFRRMAKILHPDKNNHPKAGNAFQKVYKVYEAVIGKFEGSQKI